MRPSAPAEVPGPQPHPVADRDHVASLDLEAFEQPADVAGVNPAIFRSDHRAQAMHADDASSNADRRIDGAPGGCIGIAFGRMLVVAGFAFLDDRPVPGEVTLGTNAIAAGLRSAASSSSRNRRVRSLARVRFCRFFRSADPDFFFLHRLRKTLKRMVSTRRSRRTEKVFRFCEFRPGVNAGPYIIGLS